MWRKNSWCLGIIIILLSSFALASSVRINEIYVEGTSKYEWIELYNYGNESINLTNWVFGDSSDNDTIEGELILEPNKYALLTSDSTYVYFLLDVGGCNNLYVSGALGYGLDNDGDKIYLYDNSNNIVDSLNYPDLGGNIYSLNETSNWNLVTNGTPGYANFYIDTCDPNIDILLSKFIFNEGETVYFTPKINWEINYNITYWVEDLYNNVVKNKIETSNSNQKQWTPHIDKEEQSFIIKANLTYSDCNDLNLENNFKEKFIAVLKSEDFEILDYTKIKINELFPDPQGYDDAAMPEGEFVELYNSGNEDLDLENLSLKDNYGQDYDIFISDTNTIGGTIINPQGYLIIYMNGRSGFLNNDDFEKISLYKEDYLIDQVSYSGSVEGLTWGKVDNVWKLTLPTPNSGNFYNESVNESELEIDDVDKEEYKFGDIAYVKIHIYKGNTNKYSIQTWIEKDDIVISKRSKVSIFTKFTNYDVTLPIQIVSNCEEEYEEGNYKIIVEGFDLRDEEKIEIKGNNKDICKIIKEKIVEKEVSQGVQTSEKDINASSSIEYISKEVKERNLAIYFFCVILIVMLIYFGLKNG